MMNVGMTMLVSLAIVLVAWPARAQSEPENTPVACQDGLDNDADGHIDCSDQDCSLFTFCSGSNDPAGCIKDTDCKGNRVCENGQCVASSTVPFTGNVQTGRSLMITGIVFSVLGALTGAASLGLATQSTKDDAFLFSSIGTGVSGWAFSLVGGGLQIGGQARALRSVLTLGGQPSRGLFIGGIVMYSIMGLTGISASILGPTVGAATGVGSAPFFGPLLVMEVVAASVLLAGDAKANRSLEAQTGTVSFSPFVTPLRGGGAIVGFAGWF